MLLKCTSWWFLDTNDTPTITAKNNYHCCNNHHCCLIVGFSPLVTCTTFFCCPSKKCHHSAHLVLTYQWQYYIDHCRKRQQNKDTTKATKVHGCFYFLDANTTTTAAKKHKKTRPPPRTQQPTCFGQCHKGWLFLLFFWVCLYCKAMTTTNTWMRMVPGAQFFGGNRALGPGWWDPTAPRGLCTGGYGTCNARLIYYVLMPYLEYTHIYGAIHHMYIVLPYFLHTLSTTAVFCYVLCSV